MKTGSSSRFRCDRTRVSGRSSWARSGQRAKLHQLAAGRIDRQRRSLYLTAAVAFQGILSANRMPCGPAISCSLAFAGGLSALPALRRTASIVRLMRAGSFAADHARFVGSAREKLCSAEPTIGDGDAGPAQHRVSRALASEAARRRPAADDLTIARRLSLALIGTVPSLEEIRRWKVPADERIEWWTWTPARRSPLLRLLGRAAGADLRRHRQRAVHRLSPPPLHAVAERSAS